MRCSLESFSRFLRFLNGKLNKKKNSGHKCYPNGAKLLHYSLSQQNSVQFWTDLNQARTTFTPILFMSSYFFFASLVLDWPDGVWIVRDAQVDSLLHGVRTDSGRALRRSIWGLDKQTSKEPGSCYRRPYVRQPWRGWSSSPSRSTPPPWSQTCWGWRKARARPAPCWPRSWATPASCHCRVPGGKAHQSFTIVYLSNQLVNIF